MSSPSRRGIPINLLQRELFPLRFPETAGPEREVPSDKGTPQEEMGSGEDTDQDTGSTQGICTGPVDCPEQHEAMAPDNN